MLSGRVVLVTGGAGAIGRAIVVSCAREGAIVYFCDVNDEGAAETLSACSTATYRRVDVQDEQQVQAWVESVGDQIDVLVNTAALFIFGEVDQVSSADWDRVLGVNVKGYALTMRSVIPLMKKRKRGSVVNVSSISGHVAQPAFVPYNTSKGAIEMLSKCVAHDVGSWNIRCNTVCPGSILTPASTTHARSLGLTLPQLVEKDSKRMFLGRFGTCEEVANAVLFLASDMSAYVTGTSLMVDGGYTAN